VFVGGHGKSCSFRTFSHGKANLDAKMRETLPKLPQWQFHDLRRSARSLDEPSKGSPAYPPSAVLGHAIKGVEQVYDRHEYFDEKVDALQKLAAQIDPHPRSAASQAEGAGAWSPVCEASAGCARGAGPAIGLGPAPRHPYRMTARTGPIRNRVRVRKDRNQGLRVGSPS